MVLWGIDGTLAGSGGVAARAFADAAAKVTALGPTRHMGHVNYMTRQAAGNT
jgi:hypothetical protein